MFWRDQALPSGTEIRAKAVPELRSFSAPFWSGFGAISARLLGARIVQKGRKRRSGFWTEFQLFLDLLGAPFLALPGIMCMARGGLLEGDKNDKDLEEPGKETRTGKDLEEGTGRPW